jgi:hypothetical protein
MPICDDLPWVLSRLEELADDVIEAEPRGTSQIKSAVHRSPQSDIDELGSDVIRKDGLKKSGGNANRLPIGRELGDDRTDELKKLRRTEDREGQSCGSDQRFLGNLRTQVAAIGNPIGADYRYGKPATSVRDFVIRHAELFGQERASK